jgi:UrcA family protein
LSKQLFLNPFSKPFQRTRRIRVIQNVPSLPQDFTWPGSAKEGLHRPSGARLGLNPKRRRRKSEMDNRIAASAATLACVVATLIVANTPALAATNPVPRAAVGIADIDLASAAGRKLLTSRVRMTASRICLSTNVEPAKIRVARAKCYRAAMADSARAFDHAVAMRGDRSNPVAAGAI